MNFDRKWTIFALEAEYDAFGMSRIAAAHNSLLAKMGTPSLPPDLAAIEREFAIRAASDTLNGHSMWRDGDWLEILPNEHEFCTTAIHYLEAIERLEHHPERPELVRVREESP